MTNIERAADIIEDHLARWEVAGYQPNSDHLAQALADEGLLMPDLPEPNRAGRWRSENGENYDHVRLGSVYSDNDRVVVSDGEGSRHTSMYLTTEEAIDLAYALLAAAEYAERNQE